MHFLQQSRGIFMEISERKNDDRAIQILGIGVPLGVTTHSDVEIVEKYPI